MKRRPSAVVVLVIAGVVGLLLLLPRLSRLFPFPRVPLVGDLDRDAVLLRIGRDPPGRLEISDHRLEGLAIGRSGERLGTLLRQRPDEVLG